MSLGIRTLRERDRFFSVDNAPLQWTSLLHGQVLSAPQGLQSWLVDHSSLTRRLVAACGSSFSVQLISQHRGCPSFDESSVLQMREGEGGLVRQVYLCSEGRPLVYARTIIPFSTMSGPGRRLAHLGEKPLGAVLFADKSMRRGGMAIARLRPGNPIFQRAVAGLESPPEEIWGRRSVFYLSGKPLLVSEFFLPEVAALES